MPLSQTFSRERIGIILTDEAEGEFEGTVDAMGNLKFLQWWRGKVLSRSSTTLKSRCSGTSEPADDGDGRPPARSGKRKEKFTRAVSHHLMKNF